MVKDFVSLSANVTRTQIVDEKLAQAIQDSSSLRQQVLSALQDIRANTADTMDRFSKQHSDVLATELHFAGATMLTDVKHALAELLTGVETGFDERLAKYKSGVQEKINQSHDQVIQLMRDWLSNEYYSFPRSILSTLSTDLSAAMEISGAYSVSRSSSALVVRTKSGRGEENETLRFSYRFAIDADTTGVEFWNNRRKVLELGVADLALPVGMKASMSERLKHSFKFGPKKDGPTTEPEFVKADDYYIFSARLQAEKTLVVELTEDVLKPENKMFRIAFDVQSLTGPTSQTVDTAETAALPKIDYVVSEGGQAVAQEDLLGMKEVSRMSDLAKVSLFGTAILTKLRLLQDPAIMASRGKLELLRLDEKQKDAVNTTQQPMIDFPSLLEFLQWIASAFKPSIEKLKSKTSVKDELILRQELQGGQRKEFIAKLEDLRSRLGDARYGRSVVNALGL
jgi:hypothetical protein